VAEQHDDDEKGEFPPEFQLVVEQAQARAPGREKGDGDRQSDQEHHSWFAGTDLVQRTGEEGAATDDVHHCPEQGRDPACAGEVRDVVTEQHRDMVENATTGMAMIRLIQKSLRNWATWSPPWPLWPVWPV
jgi:hypothetical protein